MPGGWGILSQPSFVSIWTPRGRAPLLCLRLPRFACQEDSSFFLHPISGNNRTKRDVSCQGIGTHIPIVLFYTSTIQFWPDVMQFFLDALCPTLVIE